MTPEQLIKRCENAIAIHEKMSFSGQPVVTLHLPRKRSRASKLRLWPGGPVGNIVGDDYDGRRVAFFNAHEVINALTSIVNDTTNTINLDQMFRRYSQH